MKKPLPAPDWPASWRQSFQYDLLEVYQDPGHPGYRYAYTARRKHALDLVSKVRGPGAKVIDIAAAQGNFTLSLAELGYEVTWNDLREELAGYVRLKHDRGIVHYRPGNILELSPTSDYDIALMTEVIEHVAHPDRFLEAVSRWVRPGGHIVLTTPNGDYFRSGLPSFSEIPDRERLEPLQFRPDADGHLFLFRREELHRVARAAGLAVLETRIFTNFLTNGHLKTVGLLKLLPQALVRGFEGFTGALPPRLARKAHAAMAVLLQRPMAA